MTPGTTPGTTATPLRELIEHRLGDRWTRFADEHPNLAASIDRVRLVESGVEQLRRDPRFLAALREADLDEAQLALAARALERVERTIQLLLPR